MPGPLWEEPKALAKVYGVSPIQRILRIDYRGLERRVLGIVKPPAKASSRAAQPRFVELPALTARRPEHLVNLEDGTGRKLTVKVSGGSLTDLVPLAPGILEVRAVMAVMPQMRLWVAVEPVDFRKVIATAWWRCVVNGWRPI